MANAEEITINQTGELIFALNLSEFDAAKISKGSRAAVCNLDSLSYDAVHDRASGQIHERYSKSYHIFPGGLFMGSLFTLPD